MEVNTAHTQGSSGPFRGMAGDLLISLGVLCFSLGAVLSVAQRALFQPDAFAERLAASLHDPRVVEFVADRIAAAVVKQKPDLTAYRPLIVGAARGAVSSPGFQALVRAAARTAYGGLFSQGGRTVIVSVPDVGVLMRSALATANPALAEKIPARVQGALATLGQGQAERVVVRLWDVSRRTEWLAVVLGLTGALLVVCGVFLAVNRRRAMARLGLDLLVAGVVLYLLGPVGRALVSSVPSDSLSKEAAAGLWDAYTLTLRTWALLLGAIGLVFQAAGHTLLERFDLRGAANRALGWLENPPGARAQLFRAALLLGAGALGVLRPAGATSFLMVVASGLVAFVGLRQIFDLVLGAVPEGQAAAAATGALRQTGLRVTVVVVVALALIGGIAWVGRPRMAPPVVSDACNGSSDLCGRRLDEVVFPGTHNSMSSADIPEWMFPQQERGIAGQLDDGIRALLFDVHYGLPVEGRVKTDLDAEGTSRAKLELAVGPEGFAAAMRIRDRLTGKVEGPRGLYLCHGFCELGATPLPAALERLHDFLVQNPNEVLVLVIEDYVTPPDLSAAFAESGLDALVYRRQARPPWPTLRDMIDTRERVLVLTESGRPGVAWIHPAFEVLQETPYHFEEPSALSCAPNRGGTQGSLFLMNNWIDTTPAPKPSNAALVNASGALLGRARDCEAQRKARPTIVAVDFYKTGDLFSVVRTLNRVAEGSAE
ncbi:MAG TPA: hypothetical protein VMV21_11355 [Vicinamibacteria bacterium]|nr:hypothetical protein [Vicinamibacteria bacterium]